MFWKKIAVFTLKFKVYFLTGIILFTGVMGYFATKVELEYTMAQLVPTDHPDLQVYRKFKERYGDEGNKLVCAFRAPDIFKINFAKDLYQVIDTLKQIKGVQGVLSPVSAYYLNLDSQDFFQMKALFAQCPQTQSELDEKAQFFHDLKFYKNLIYNDETKVSLLILSLDPKIMDSSKKVELISAASELIERFGERQKREIHISGLPFVRYKNATTIKNEILFFTALAFLVTALLIFLLFRSISTLLVSLLFISIGVLIMLGISGMLGYKLNVLTGILPPLLVVVGVQNTIYLINAYHDIFRTTRNKSQSLIHIISHVGVPNFLINFTTAIGFGTFYFTNTTILEKFGLVAFITINLLFVVTIIGVPILYSYLPEPSTKQTKHLDNQFITKLIQWTEHWVFERKRRIFYWFFVIVILSAIFMIRLKPLAFMVDDIPHKSKTYTDLQYIQEHFHGAMPYEILVTAYDEGAAREVPMLSKARKLQRALTEFPELSKPMSIVEVISAANQAAHENDPRFYRIPSSLELGNLAMKIPSNKNSSANQNLFKGLIDSSFTQLRISYQMKDIGSTAMDSLNNQIQQIARDVFPAEEYKVSITGTTPIFLKGNAYLYDSLLQATFWSLLIISLTLTFLFPSWRMVLIAVIPNIAPLIITAGTMGIAGIPLKPSTILIFSIAFGITVDSTIHFVSIFRKEIIKHRRNVRAALSLTIQQVGHSMVYSAIAVCSGFAIFIFSDFKGTQSMGWLTGLTIFGGLAANLFLLPALILAFEKFINPKIELKETLLELDEDQPQQPE